MASLTDIPLLTARTEWKYRALCSLRNYWLTVKRKGNLFQKSVLLTTRYVFLPSGPVIRVYIVYVYIKLFVCLFVCLYLIQIHISEPIWTKLCTHLPLGLEETVVNVWNHNIWPFRPFPPLLSGASAESWAEVGCRRKSHPRQRYIRDCSTC